ncbi:MAG: LysR substrate-binding domain-containing protein [Hydrogenovibrio sp.]|uniref:LysR family transcriptional regulator n=1 Tax=Hydrogenovibrio TaxID=28884 RepID=UPI00035C4EC3|nr:MULTISPECIES: LysR family transcriptional regulator [Hydrogenovibrio]MDR9500101.1 LysR substrate-binding domain-containing protein [Hydrogenovibrio sp.]
MAQDIPDYAQHHRLMRHTSLRQLQIFESVARNLSFTRAAEELHLTQPTVSAQIKGLSEAVELPLYEQVGRKIYLTDVGREVALSCRTILNTFSNLEMTLDDFRGKTRGRLRVAVVTTAKYFAPLALGEFCKDFPEIDLQLTVVNREKLYKRIENNLDDLYIVGQVPSLHLDLEIHPFAPNPLVPIAHRDHPLVNKPRISLKRLAKEPFIMREPGSGIRSAVEDRFAEQKLTLHERLVLDSNEAIKHGVAGGLGVSVVSQHALNLESDDGPLAILDVEGFPIEREWNLVYPRGKAMSIISKAFFDFLQEKGTGYLRLKH